MTDISDQIRQFRKYKGLTQKEFSEQLGISEATVIRYETGKYEPSTQFYKQLKLKFPEADVSQFINIQGVLTKKQPATDGGAMFETTDGYYVSRDPNTGRLTRMKKDDTNVVEVRINGEWVPDQAP